MLPNSSGCIILILRYIVVWKREIMTLKGHKNIQFFFSFCDETKKLLEVLLPCHSFYYCYYYRSNSKKAKSKWVHF